MDYFPVIAAERRAIADMLDGLSPQQWETQSLCAGWTVRHMAAHLRHASRLPGMHQVFADEPEQAVLAGPAEQ